MKPVADFPEELRERYDFLAEQRPNIAQLNMPLNSFMPTFDAYLTDLCKRTGDDPSQIDMARFSSLGLCRMLQWMQIYGFLGRAGNTVNVYNYLLEFPAAEVNLLWIPKNSCTSVKKTLLAFEPEEKRSRIRQHRFHETMQSTFGLDIKQFFNDDFGPLTVLVRHPAERLVSCYIDKFVNPLLKDRNFEPFVIPHIIAAQILCGVKPDTDRSISFSEFVDYIIATPPWRLDAHWRPQADFLGNLERERTTNFVRSDNLDYLASTYGLDFEAKRHNSSGGKAFYPGEGGTGEFTDALPAEMELSRLEAYNQFFSAGLLEKLFTYFEEDTRLFEHAN